MVRKIKLCECDCEQEVKPGNRFINGHNNKGKPAWNKDKKFEEEKERRRKPFIIKYCECKCKTLLPNANKGQKFIQYHNRKGKTIWNNGLTKETDNRVRQYSETLIEGYASGRIKLFWKHRNTSIENAIANELKKVGLNFISQHYIKGVGFVDFFLPDFNLIVECDGNFWHNLERAKRKDTERDFSAMFLYEYQTVRFWGHEINESPKKCVKKIMKICKKPRNF